MAEQRLTSITVIFLLCCTKLGFFSPRFSLAAILGKYIFFSILVLFSHSIIVDHENQSVDWFSHSELKLTPPPPPPNSVKCPSSLSYQEMTEFADGKVIKTGTHSYLFALHIQNFSSILLHYLFSSNCFF